MILNSVSMAFQRLFTPPYRSMLWKSLAMTLLVLALLWFAVRAFFLSFVFPWILSFLPGMPDWVGWIGFIGLIIFSFGLALVMALLIAPITALIGGFFIDDAAEVIECEDYPTDPKGKALSLGRSTVISLKFLLLSLIGNAIALALFFVPGINLVAFYVINGYLLGREYFSFAAMRLREENEAYAFYRQHSFTVFCAGLVIAIFVSVPVLNLASPLFAAALMTHLHKQLSAKPPITV